MDPETAKVAGIILSELRRNSGYLARQEIEKLLNKIRGDEKRLEPFGFKVYSQNDEDGIIEEIFNRIGTRQGRFCEIGVENGLECNTRAGRVPAMGPLFVLKLAEMPPPLFQKSR